MAKDCGLCGEKTCVDLLKAIEEDRKAVSDCPNKLFDYFVPTIADFNIMSEHSTEPTKASLERNEFEYKILKKVQNATKKSNIDILGNLYDFVLSPLPGEPSARKIVLPFTDMRGIIQIEKDGVSYRKDGIHKGSVIQGRPMSAGCPIPHVLEVIEIDHRTGVLTCWVIGPEKAREGTVINVGAYHMLGFEGIATEVYKEPKFGRRVSFLPGFCMMNITHTGIVNQVLRKSEGLHVRIEGIIIM